MIKKKGLLVCIAILSFGFIAGDLCPAGADTPVRIMPLGDSITYDSRLGDTRPASERTGYRQKLWLLLQAAGYSVDFVGSLQAGGAAVPAFDPDNEGHSGWRADEIADDIYGWLQNNPADIVLLHIGTNELDTDPDDVADILNEIDRFENDYGIHITVFLARIINRVPYDPMTTLFNSNVAAMVDGRVNDPGNPAYPDSIVLVDMEDGAGLLYELDTTAPYTDGDMYDDLHPNVSGFEKMALTWFAALADHFGSTGQGSITIVKATLPAGGTGFGFAGDLGAFTLDAGQDRFFNGLPAPRDYDVTEIMPFGWSLQNAVCTGGSSTPITGGVSVHLTPGANITCTFTNAAWDEGVSGTYLDDGSGPPAQFSFLDGSLTDLTFNDALNALVLDKSSAGSFVSQIFDAGGKVFWSGIEWIGNGGELPDEGMSDESVDLLDNVLLYHLNKDAAQGETGTVVHDFSGSGHTGTASGTGVSVGAAGSGKFSGGYAADASNDAGHIEVPASPDFNFATTADDGFAFFLWFNKSGICDAPDDTNEVMASRFGTADTVNTWWLGCGVNGGEYSNRLVFRFLALQAEDQKILSSSAAINDGQWHHGGWVYDPAAGEIRLYLDGQAVATAPTTPAPFTSANPLCIGAYGSSCGGYEFVGKLDEVTVFKRPLTPGEVKDLYSRGVVELNLQVRACDDAACSGESFIDLGTAGPPQSLSLVGDYFQYAFDFTTAKAGYSPELYFVTVKNQVFPDIDGDGDVDGSDLYLFKLSYGKSLGNTGYDARCDLDLNDVVDASDLKLFAGAFGG